MLKLFNSKWNEVPTVWLDVETTGTVPGVDAAVQVALVRFEAQVPVERFSSLINPERTIPAEVVAIHGIDDERVKDAPTIDDVMARPEVLRLLAGAQLGAFNAEFDRRFIPPAALCVDDKEGWRWPWFDSLSWVRFVDRFVRGAGRHKLSAACERRGIVLENAHDAASDAQAAGVLFYRVIAEALAKEEFGAPTVGELLRRQRDIDSGEWFRFCDWLSRQPPREVSP